MRSAELTGQRERLQALFEKVEGTDDIELKAHLARYLCVLASGFIENALRTMYSDYSAVNADGRSARYVKSKLKRFYNPRMHKILALSDEFSEEWAAELKRETAGARRAAIDSIVNNRNKIAHGDDVSISYGQLKEYYERVLEVVDLIDGQCDV
jgi:hypothetical protein